MWSFLDLCSIYRIFVHRFAEVAATLDTRLLKRKTLRFEHDKKKQEAVYELNWVLVSPSVLALSNSTRQCTVDPDSADSQSCCVFLKKQESKQLKPIGYW